MNGSIGIELDGRSLRAVRLDGARGQVQRVLETAWDPEGPAEGIRVLREGLGRAARVAVAVRLPLLFTKRVRLPPMSPVERRKMLRLEPQRYFPVRLEDLVVAVREDDLVFAAREESVEGWMRALGELGPVELVEPGPVALARALQTVGIRDGVVALDDGERGTGVIDLRDGTISGVRRLYGADPEVPDAFPADPEAAPRRHFLSPWTEERAGALAGRGAVALAPLPDAGPIPAAFLSAYGAALAAQPRLDETLLPDQQRERILNRRRTRLAAAIIAAAASAAFLLASLDAWRERTADRLARDVAALEAKAAPALKLQRQLEQLDRRAQGIAEAAGARLDPLRTLQVITQRLPRGAYVRSLRFAGGEWQVEGFAPRAAQVTQSLGSAPELSDVRVLAATNRARTGEETNESFSLAFRLVRKP
jgi:Tfp pilus assembly protein PilN